MSEAGSSGADGDTIGHESRAAAAASATGRGAADWIALAATPTFAIMALLTGAFGGGQTDMICSAARASPLGGMAPMYLLMSAFHAAPWLRLLSPRRNGPASDQSTFRKAGTDFRTQTCAKTRT